MPDPCSICSQLKDVQTSFYKYAAPEYDIPLPPAAARLAVVLTPDLSDPEVYHVRCCPECGTLYTYRFSYEYHTNGSEDEEELSRMASAEARGYLRAQARALEALRRDIDALENNAGRWADYIDRGHPAPAETEAARAAMDNARKSAQTVRKRLQEQVEDLRTTCPGILTTWSAAHVRVCNTYVDNPTGSGEDAQTGRHVARKTAEAWERLPYEGKTFISIASVWMEGYDQRLDADLAPDMTP